MAPVLQQRPSLREEIPRQGEAESHRQGRRCRRPLGRSVGRFVVRERLGRHARQSCGQRCRQRRQQQHQKEVNAVATISDRVKLWLQIRRAVASELEDEVHSVTSESFYTSESEFSGSGPEFSDVNDFEEFGAALVIQAQVRGWMLTKKAATIIQHKVRCWLEQQEASGSFAGGADGENVNSGGSGNIDQPLVASDMLLS